MARWRDEGEKEEGRVCVCVCVWCEQRHENWLLQMSILLSLSPALLSHAHFTIDTNTVALLEERDAGRWRPLQSMQENTQHLCWIAAVDFEKHQVSGTLFCTCVCVKEGIVFSALPVTTWWRSWLYLHYAVLQTSGDRVEQTLLYLMFRMFMVI